MQKFVFIRVPGVFTIKSRHNQPVWSKKVEEYFPGSTTYFERFYYTPFDFLKIKKYDTQVIEEIENSNSLVVLVGLSYGGFLSYQVASFLKKHKKHPFAVACYATPFILKRKLSHLNIPEIHFYGKGDPLVPSFLAKYDKCPHTHIISGGHNSLAKGKNLDEFLSLLSEDLKPYILKT